MNLSQLSFVDAVASERSFTAAASKCHVTQPTLSSGIRQLEEELGGRLFDRTTRSVRLTELGQHLLPYVRDVLSAQQMLLSESKRFLHPRHRLIRVGISPLIDAARLGSLLEPFRGMDHETDVVLREMNMADLYRMLEEGLLDYVFGVVDTHRRGWGAAPLYQEPLLFIPSGTTPYGRKQTSVRVNDIAHETFVMVPDACGLARTTRALFRANRKKVREYPGQAMGYRVLEEWAALKIGAAILPQSKVTPATAAYPITDKAGRTIKIAFEAVWVAGAARMDHLLAFERYLRTVVPGIVRGMA